MRALITGVAGQDGTLLSQLLLRKNYEVVGLARSIPTHLRLNLDESKRFTFIQGDLLEGDDLEYQVKTGGFDEIYNLAAFNSIADSFLKPELCKNMNVNVPKRIIETIRKNSLTKVRFFNAASSEIYSPFSQGPLNENSPTFPESPYGKSKLEAMRFLNEARESSELYISNGILFNHESEYRQEHFFSKKVIKLLTDISRGNISKLTLNNGNSYRDWGYAADYTLGMWLSLQSSTPNDYVFASGVLRSTREFIGTAMECLNLTKPIEEIIDIDSEIIQSNDPRRMIGDPTRAIKQLGWKHTKNFRQLIEHLVKVEVERIP